MPFGTILDPMYAFRGQQPDGGVYALRRFGSVDGRSLAAEAFR